MLFRSEEFRISDAGDGMGDAVLLRQHAGDNIHLIHGRHRHQQVALRSILAPHKGRTGTVGMDGKHIQVWGNSDLEAEKSRTFDIGLEFERGNGAGKVTYFHNKIKNMINSQLLGRFGRIVRYQYVNIDNAVMDGVEGEYSYRFNKHWDAKVNLTYLDARDKETNARISENARMNGLVQISWTDAKENPKNYTYSTTNFVVTKDISKSTQIYAGVDNIFDKTFSDDDDYSIYGRTWRTGVTFKF